MDWLEEIAPYQSGKTKRYFPWTGDIELMYSKYMSHFNEDFAITYEIQKFVEIVEHERIGIHSGDLFFDENKKKFKLMTEWKESGDARFNEETYKLLEKQVNFNNERKKMLRTYSDPQKWPRITINHRKS